jgi:hypothetical protein
LQSRLISFEEAVHNATNPDEFKMRVSGILSTEQAIDDDDRGNRGTTEPRHQEFESMIVKL